MANKPTDTIAQVLKAQGELQRDFDKAHSDYVKAQKSRAEKKAELTEFNGKYGRVCKLLLEGSE